MDRAAKREPEASVSNYSTQSKLAWAEFREKDSRLAAGLGSDGGLLRLGYYQEEVATSNRDVSSNTHAPAKRFKQWG
jgi:hypothetical protein